MAFNPTLIANLFDIFMIFCVIKTCYIWHLTFFYFDDEKCNTLFKGYKNTHLSWLKTQNQTFAELFSNLQLKVKFWSGWCHWKLCSGTGLKCPARPPLIRHLWNSCKLSTIKTAQLDLVVLTSHCSQVLEIDYCQSRIVHTLCCLLNSFNLYSCYQSTEWSFLFLSANIVKPLYLFWFHLSIFFFVSFS